MFKTNGKNVLARSGCEAVYASCEYLMRYIAGMAAENGCVLVDGSGTTFYTDKRYIEAAEKRFQGMDVTPAIYSKEEVFQRLASYASVGVSFKEMSHSEYLTLTEANVKLVNADDALQGAMTIKNDWEIENITKACEIAEKAFNALLPEIREGMTESEVAAMLEYEMRKFGAESTSFATIVAFGAHASVPHHETGDTKLRFGDEILIDFGCKVNGYCSDITRTFLFGDDGKHEEFKKAYAAVLAAHELAKEKIVSGMTGAEADAIARDSLKAAGYGELFTHSLGHGVGLNIHETPMISPRNEKGRLCDGMIFSDEPGVYKPGEYGIRIEDTVRLENGRVKSFMTLTNRNLFVL